MNLKSSLTSEMIRNTSLWEVVPMYLREGETKEALLKRHGGDVVKLIKFLRARSYEGMEIVERKPKPVEKKPAQEKIKAKPAIAKEPSPTTKKGIPITIGTKPPTQESLF